MDSFIERYFQHIEELIKIEQTEISVEKRPKKKKPCFKQRKPRMQIVQDLLAFKDDTFCYRTVDRARNSWDRIKRQLPEEDRNAIESAWHEALNPDYLTGGTAPQELKITDGYKRAMEGFATVINQVIVKIEG